MYKALNSSALFAALFTSGAMFANISPSQAAVINPGFESQFLVQGASTSPITGWTGGGVFNPSVSSYFSVPEGSNVAILDSGTIFQDLLEALVPGNYSLTVAIGNRLDTAFLGATIEILAGANVIATNTIAGGAVLDGQFQYLNAAVNILPGNPFLGQSVGIRFSTPGPQASFDDVNFISPPVPFEFSPALGLSVLAGLGVMSYMKRRVKLENN